MNIAGILNSGRPPKAVRQEVQRILRAFDSAQVKLLAAEKKK